ncbi:hypothetical protein D9757_000381 [Collybiopsis confluens]|uniref:Isochorismatase-like domain-containing protein n=1 Tax=Collybiopsis confluens TaxID=2823264 RepID=A0A8H5I273_9AGAR|nr:hypothetical protein D9757_000381 [Collybiopsis confluens]
MATKSIFLLCDVQSRFRPAIYQYASVIASTNKMLKFAKLFGIPVLATTQNARALGPIDPEIDLPSLGSLHLTTLDKSLFGMITEDVKDVLKSQAHPPNVVIMGIESHICVLQTALQVLDFYQTNKKPVNVSVVADAVSSCNAFEVPLAFDALRQAGAKVLSSESIGFSLMRDASLPTFKAFAGIVKESKPSTKAAGEALLVGGSKEKSSM